jgi:peptide/nickel transport system permease protein
MSDTTDSSSTRPRDQEANGTVAQGVKNPGQLSRAVKRFSQDRLAVLGLIFLVIVGVAGLLHQWISPFDPAEQLAGDPFESPSWDHLAGTDHFGRDVLSRLLQGAWNSMRFSLLVVSAALLAALPIGLISGYAGGKVDYILMRIMDAILSFPGLVLAIAIVSVLGASLTNAMIAIGVGMTPGFARLIRGQALAVKEEVFMEASRAIGTSRAKTIVRHLLPNILSPLIVQASIVFGIALLIEAALSFLGLGAQPPQASWGSMLQDSYDRILIHPWHVLPSGLAITFTVLAFNTVGDGLRAALGVAQPVRRYGRLGLTSIEREAPSEKEAPVNAPDPVLVVDSLSLEFAGPAGPVRVLDDVSFDVGRGETLGLVGESGSGKTVTAMSIMRLLQSPPATITGGSVRFEGRDLLALPFEEMSRLRGNDIAMIFQDPGAALNPAQRVGFQIAQVARWHDGASRNEARSRALEALDHVGISKVRADAYPHEMSGGMRQRAMIAMALVGRPKVLIADEPTTALDVTIQAQVLELLKELRSELGMSMIFVTHDLGVVADICDRVAVMYAGQIVETGDLRTVFKNPQHPYTEGLLKAMPQSATPRSDLFVIPGQVPNFAELGEGCRLASRCSYVVDSCRSGRVELTDVGTAHLARCVRSHELSLSPTLDSPSSPNAERAGQ